MFSARGRKSQRQQSNRIESLNERLSSGDINQEQYNQKKQGQVKAFAFRGSNALTSLIGAKVLEKTGGSVADQQKRYDSLGKSEQDRIREMVRQAIIKQSEGLDTTRLANEIASAIQGRLIEIKLNSNAVTTMLEGSVSRIRR
tara:strand:- start:29203 stop:29631 length:429 start_codon:yes stop_codon:yes gene_type:complete